MNRLIIIGNGFDLAHGLKTSYCDFIDWVFEEKSKEENKIENQLFKINFLKLKKNPFFENFTLYNRVAEHFFKNPNDLNAEQNGIISFDNFLFKVLIHKQSLNNWVDIENEYFNLLLEFVENDYDKKEIFKLNQELNEISEVLEFYLLGIQEKGFQNLHYYQIFDKAFRIENIKKILILNFNYTNTILKYANDPSTSFRYANNIEIINIHGQLNDKRNPLIFGYGDERHPSYDNILNSKSLSNEILRNVKHYKYLQNKNYDKLISFLDSFDFDVKIYGHSFGNSDRTLLNEIFEHPHLISENRDTSERVKGIEIFRRGDKDEKMQREFYEDIIIQLSRVLNNSADVRKKVKNFEDSEVMPCWNPYKNL